MSESSEIPLHPYERGWRSRPGQMQEQGPPECGQTLIKKRFCGKSRSYPQTAVEYLCSPGILLEGMVKSLSIATRYHYVASRRRKKTGRTQLADLVIPPISNDQECCYRKELAYSKTRHETRSKQPPDIIQEDPRQYAATLREVIDCTVRLKISRAHVLRYIGKSAGDSRRVQFSFRSPSALRDRATRR